MRKQIHYCNLNYMQPSPLLYRFIHKLRGGDEEEVRMKRQPFRNAFRTQHPLLPPAERPPGKGRFHTEAAPTPYRAQSPSPNAVLRVPTSITLATSTCRDTREPQEATRAGEAPASPGFVESGNSHTPVLSLPHSAQPNLSRPHRRPQGQDRSQRCCSPLAHSHQSAKLRGHMGEHARNPPEQDVPPSQPRRL